MSKTKLNTNNLHHKLLISCLANFVTDYGYTTRELYDLLDNAKNNLWHGLVELEKENRK